MRIRLYRIAFLELLYLGAGHYSGAAEVPAAIQVTCFAIIAWVERRAYWPLLDYLAHVGTEKTLSSIEKIWNEMSPRSPAASFWADLVVESHQVLGASRLEGVLKVWNRLREVIPADPTQFEIIDLDWARKVILELRNLERGRTQDQSLEFQASVLALLSRGSPVYYAFARNLADSYVRNGDTKSALTLRQQIWQDLQPTSRIYNSWARELAGLYHRIGREEEAIQLTIRMKERRGGNVNIAV
ncbi:hypothetical protein TMatcc_006302 [Talaromyces marneffei ATCC 18224]